MTPLHLTEAMKTEGHQIVRSSKRDVLRELIDRWCRQADKRIQMDLATAIGVHPVTLARWRSGDRSVPDWILAWIAEQVNAPLTLDASAGWSIVDPLGPRRSDSPLGEAEHPPTEA